MIHSKLAPINYNNYNNLMLSYEERLAAIQQAEYITQIIKEQTQKIKNKSKIKLQKNKISQSHRNRSSSNQVERKKKRSTQKNHHKDRRQRRDRHMDKFNKKQQKYSQQSKSYEDKCYSQQSQSSWQSQYSCACHYQSSRYRQDATNQKVNPKYTPFFNGINPFSNASKKHNTFDKNQQKLSRNVEIDSRKPNMNSQIKTRSKKKTNSHREQMVVLVFNLDYKINEKAFTKIGQLYGEVEKCKILYDKITLRSKQAGILWYRRFSDGERAAQKLNQQIVNSKQLEAKFIKYKKFRGFLRDYLKQKQEKNRQVNQQ